VPRPEGEDYTFICYARRDGDFVLDLAARLKQGGCPVWLDQWNIEPGQDWDQTIDAALAGCAAFLIVLSPYSVRSPEVRGELRSALNRGKRVLPILLRPCDVPRQLQTTQHLDLTDLPELTDEIVDEVAGALRGEAPAGGDRWRDAQTPLGLLARVTSRLKAIGAATVGGLVLLAISGLLVEASYARLLGVPLGRSAAAVLYSGVQFFITMLTQALVIALPAGALFLLLYSLGRAGRRLLPDTAAGDAGRRALARPGLLWAGQLAACLVLLVSLTRFPDRMPLVDVAFNRGLSSESLDKVKHGGANYRAIVLYVAFAMSLVVGLEAWRRRLHRRRRFQDQGQAVLSLGLALPVYALAAAELVLLPVGHGLLWLPARRQESSSVVSFKSSARQVELRGKTLRLLDLRSTSRGTFYCPQGPRLWRVREEDIDAFAETTTLPLAQLLVGFERLVQCEVPGRAS
jgi:hypothetical protein